MLKEIEIVINSEKKKIEDWINGRYGSVQNLPVDILIMLLYKINLLEEKVDKIEYQTRTHWVN
jgi:hypothetical protein